MPTTLIGRLVLFDLLKITLLTLVALSGLFVMAGAMIEADKFGLEPTRVAALIPLLIPPTLPYTLPTSVLFACTFVYGRLSSHQEILALKAGGVHVIHVMIPALLVGAACSAVGMYLTDRFIPECQNRMHEQVMEDIEGHVFAYLRQTGMIVDPTIPYEIYVKDVRDDRLIQAVFKQRGEGGRYDLVAMAEEATLNVVPAGYSQAAHHPAEPMIEIRLLNSVAKSRTAQGHMQNQVYQMPLPAQLRGEGKSKTLTLTQCAANSKDYLRKESEADFYIASSGLMNTLNGELVPFCQVLPINRAYADRQASKATEMWLEIHTRLSHSTAALLFACLGCPIGILFQRKDFLQTFFVCFLPIITVFYPSLILAQNVVKEGYAPPSYTTWAPTLVMFVVGLVLIRRVLRH